jgi:hypothetical protein
MRDRVGHGETRMTAVYRAASLGAPAYALDARDTFAGFSMTGQAPIAVAVDCLVGGRY